MIDKYNRKIEYVRISLTDRCNLRCQYCMPEVGITKVSHSDILTLEEILRITKSLARLGIRKVRLTGGEPLLRKGIVNLIHDIKSIDGIEQIMLTTNGVLLANMVDDLISAGLDGVNLSLDTLDEGIFNTITRRNSFANVLSSLHKIIRKNLIIKINCVPIAGINESEIIKVASLAKDNNIKVRFIELMPIGCALNFKGIPMSTIKTYIEDVFGKLNPIDKSDKLQGPAQYFKLANFIGEIGFIDAIEHKFCSSCNRVRLTSNGFLKLCLNSNFGLDVKSLVRSNIDDEQLTDSLRKIIYDKPHEHNFYKKVDDTKMYQVGG